MSGVICRWGLLVSTNDTKPSGEAKGPNLVKQGTIVSSMTLLSRISGFGRDVVLSHFFGAAAAADAFFVAFRIPNFFRRLFAEGAFAQAFIPVLADYQQGPIAALQRFTQIMSGNLALIVSLVTVLGVVGAPAFVLVFAPGFASDGSQFALTAELLRITFPYLLFISLTAFAGAVLNVRGQFAIPAFTPVLLNLCLIVAALAVAPQFDTPVLGLAWGVFAAGIVQLLFQFPAMRRLELLARPRLDFKDTGARQVGRLLLPAIFAASASQINTLIDTMLASTLITGSISWLYYADRLLELPVGLVAVALGTVLLPNLSRLHADADRESFSATLDWGLRMAMVLGLPAAVALYLLALPLVSGIFLHGEMTTTDAQMSAQALRAFSLGLLGMLIVKVLAPGYFARKDTRTPLNFAFVAVGTNIVLNLLLYRKLGHVGLALATSIAALVNGGLLLRGLLREGVYVPTALARRTLVQVLVGLAAMAAVLVALVPAAPLWLQGDMTARWLWILGLCVSGGLAYAVVAWIAGLRLGGLRHSLASQD